MEKIIVTVDLLKIDKSKIEDKTFVNRAGEKVASKNLKLDVVALKEPQTIKEGDGWRLDKTHFVAMAQTEEERKAKADTVFVGDGIQFADTGAPQVSSNPGDEIPF